MNSRGITAIVDASVFILLIGIAAAFVGITLGDPGEESTVQDPAVLLDRLMSAKVSAEDIGMEPGFEKSVPMYRLAYDSLRLEDGCFAAYLERILEEVYPWDGAFGCTMECGGHSVSIGKAGIDAWMGCTKTYQTGRSTDLNIVLYVYR